MLKEIVILSVLVVVHVQYATCTKCGILESYCEKGHYLLIFFSI